MAALVGRSHLAAVPGIERIEKRQHRVGGYDVVVGAVGAGVGVSGKDDVRAQLRPGRKMLAKVWADVLNLKQVGLEDDFFCRYRPDIGAGSKNESRREILWHGCERVDDLPGEIARLIGNAFVSAPIGSLPGSKPASRWRPRWP